MKRTSLLIPFLLAAACQSQDRDGGSYAPIDVPTPRDPAVIDLLGGSLDDRWRGYRKEGVPEGWSLAEGVLTTTGNAGDLITVETFGDFVLELEWRVGEGGNSGIFYRATEATDQIYMNAAEMQILDNAGAGVEPTSANAAGANYALHAPPADFAKPAGEWNHARVEALGDRIQHYLNGELVCAYAFGSDEWEELVANSKFSAWPEYGRASSGHVGLQGHGDPVEFRNVHIERLPAVER